MPASCRATEFSNRANKIAGEIATKGVGIAILGRNPLVFSILPRIALQSTADGVEFADVQFVVHIDLLWRGPSPRAGGRSDVGSRSLDG
jgi:hypothetical protein